MDSLAGHFLIASPAILDPNFERAVVLITAHTDEGAVGVILNRCSSATVGEAVPQLAPVIDIDEPVFVGGPVNPDGVAVLAEFEDPDDAGIVVLDDVGFVAIEEALEVQAPDLQRAQRALHHIGLEVAPEDFQALQDRLRGQGYAPRSGQHPFMPVDAIYLDDPDGNEVEIATWRG